MNTSAPSSLTSTIMSEVVSLVPLGSEGTSKAAIGWSLGTGQVLVANLLGALSSVIFMAMYLPQFLLNNSRRSTQGFSSTGIIIKLIGASFLSVNAFVTGETLAVVLYGTLGVLQHQAFMFQFFLYETRNNMNFVLWILFPVVPYLMAEWLPFTIMITSYIKPFSQVLSHIPQLLECHRLKTCAGVSLLSQHLNFVGGLMGVNTKKKKKKKKKKLKSMVLFVGICVG
jgi:uncharacterized protein with PQ loop repeat